jgi:hypothetical protein
MADLSLSVVCPVCGAQPEQECRLGNGEPFFKAHLQRKWVAQKYARVQYFAEASRVSDIPKWIQKPRAE